MTPSPTTNIRERIAEYAHNAWSGWMRHVFKSCSDGKTLPDWGIKEWKRQFETSYQDLSEKEKDLDRNEADQILTLISEEIEKMKARLPEMKMRTKSDRIDWLNDGYHLALSDILSLLNKQEKGEV